MRRGVVRLILLTVLVALLVVPLAGAAVLRTSGGGADRLSARGRVDDRSSPLKAEKQARLQRALEQLLNGKTHSKASRWRGGSTSSWRARASTASGRCRAISPTWRTTRSRNQTAASTTRPSGGRTSTPPTTRTCCSTTTPGANSMRNFYIEQSSNRFTVNGKVSDWVQGAGQRRRPTMTTWAARPSGSSSSTRRPPGTRASSRPARRPPRSTSS